MPSQQRTQSPDAAFPASPIRYQDDLAQVNAGRNFQEGTQQAANDVGVNSGRGDSDPIKLYDPITQKAIGTFVFHKDGTCDINPEPGYTFETLAQALRNISGRYPQFKDMTADKLRYKAGLLHSTVRQPFDGTWGLRLQAQEFVYQWGSPSDNKAPNVTINPSYATTYTAPNSSASVVPVFTPDVAKQQLMAVGAELKAYLVTLTPEQQVQFWDAYRYYTTGKAPDNYNVAVRSSTYVDPSVGGDGDTGQYVPPQGPITAQAATFVSKYREIQKKIDEAQLTARINGFTTFLGGVGSMAMAVLTSESVVGAVYFGTIGVENMGSGAMQMWHGWEWNGDSPLSLTLELVGVNKTNAQTAAFVVSTLPAGAGSYASAVRAINSTSRLTRVVNTVVAVDQGLTAATGAASALTGQIQTPPQQQLLVSWFGERGAALFNLGTTGIGQANALNLARGNRTGVAKPEPISEEPHQQQQVQQQQAQHLVNKPAGDGDDPHNRRTTLDDDASVAKPRRQMKAVNTKLLTQQQLRALNDPTQNFAHLPQYEHLRQKVKAEFGSDHELVIGYNSGELTAVWGNFDAMRGQGWITDPIYIALDQRPTLRYGIMQTKTDASGTFMDPIVVARSAQVSGQPVLVNAVPDGHGGYSVNLVPTNDPNLAKTVQTNREVFAGRLAQNGITNMDGFLNALGQGQEIRLFEVGSVYVEPDSRAGMGYGYHISILSKQLQKEVLGSNFISSADPDNWSNSPRTTRAVYAGGAMHPRILYAYPKPDGTGGIPNCTFIGSDNPHVQSYLVGQGWISLDDFIKMSSGPDGVGKRFNANHNSTGLPTMFDVRNVPPMPAQGGNGRH